MDGMTSESLGSTIIPREARNTNLKNGENMVKYQVNYKLGGKSEEFQTNRLGASLRKLLRWALSGIEISGVTVRKL